MNQEIKKKWVDALRSGTYTQVVGMLEKRDKENCCLGVLCNITPTITKHNHTFYFGTGKQDGEADILSVDMLKSVGLSEKDQRHLVRMNDSGISFEQIADWIEANL